MHGAYIHVFRHDCIVILYIVYRPFNDVTQKKGPHVLIQISKREIKDCITL